MADSKIRHVTVSGLRLHLRRGEPNLLWVNGRDLLLVNDTAAEFLEAFIDEMSRHPDHLDVERFKGEVASRMQQKYPQVPAAVLARDFDGIYGALVAVGKGDCPIEDVKLGTREIDPRQWAAPPRMDLALTYACNNDCGFCYTGGPRRSPELSTAEWKKVIDVLWENGVPQVVFTGGEPTLRDDLTELIDHSREFVTGLVTNGRRLAALAHDLKRVELDYIQVSLESHLPQIHDRMVGVEGAWKESRDGIVRALEADLEVVTNTTLTRDNLAHFPELIKAGAGLGLKTMACNTLICSGRGTCSRSDGGVSADELKGTLSKARETAGEVGVNVEWYSPTCYKQFNPLELGLGAKSCSAALYNMTVEPDGAVIPCQSWFHEQVGHVLSDPWPRIWNHPICVGFRERAYLKDRKECEGCEYLQECHGGCPLEHSR